MHIEYIPISVIQSNIELYRNSSTELNRARFKYYKILLEYRKEEERTDLRDLIKRKLNICTVGGSYEISDISKVLSISKSEVKTTENKILRILKHPSKSKKLKMYLGGYK